MTQNSLPNLAVLGASGVVGREILKILVEEDVKFNTIKFLASARSAGKKIEFKGNQYTIIEALPEAFEGVNIVLASAGAATSRALAPEALKRGCVFIDNSSAFRMEPTAPLVIAGVNDEDLKNHKGLVPNPNCSTSQLMPVLKPLNDYAKIKRLIVSTYQAVSGAGLKAINELTENTKAAIEGKPFQNEVFKHEIAFNVIPQIDTFLENGYTKEEMKVAQEARKILHLPESVPISCTAVRVPVYNSHSEAVTIEFEKQITPEKAREILGNIPEIVVADEPENYIYPTPKMAAGKNPVYVGRIRKSLAFENGIELFCVADNLRIGAALNTVRLAKKIIEMKLY